jgi:uncharacterized protein (DUF2147 family)
MFTRKTDSSSRQPVRRSRLGKAGAAAAAVAFAATAVPMALAGPAQASDDHHGCDVKPLKPMVEYNDHGKHDDYVDYRIKVHCDDDYGIELYDQRWEEDDGPDDYLGDWSGYHYFDHEDTRTFHIKRTAPDTEHGDEEVYHRVTYRVYYDGHWSDWKDWKYSRVECVYQ